MNIMGIDASSTSTGWCVLRLDQREIIYLDSGFIKLAGKHQDLATRCGKIITTIQRLCFEYKIQCAMIETTLLGSHYNVRSALTLAEAKGAAAGSVAALGIPVREVLPTVWKNQVIGDPKADKETTMRCLQVRFSHDETFPSKLQHDQSDAIAIAVFLAAQLALESLTP